MKLRFIGSLALFVAILPGPVSAQVEVQRFVLAVGANFGGADRPMLHYAVTDADRFARVLTELGGVNPSNVVMVREPKVRELVGALDQLSARVREGRRVARNARSEILFYYSGHADEKGLLLGDDRFSYQSLRDRLDDIPSDVRIAVLDACASGAFTRLKGGKDRKPFLVDQSVNMRGHAYLTSSAETEAAQESDHIGASYFTYYLVSGLRGAADVNGEGKVTLSEAYQFAFNETLGKTVGSSGGAQHPSYEINLSGTGDVVITDLRQTTAAIVLGEALEGRVFIRGAKQELVVELYKSKGRRIEIGLEEGAYEVRVERPRSALIAKATIASGDRLELASDRFTPTTPELTRRRGGPPSLAVAGRNRVELNFGMWRTGAAAPAEATPIAAGISASASSTDVRAGFQYTRFLRENLATTLSVTVLPGSSKAAITAGGISSSGSSVVMVPVGLRWNPVAGDLRRKAIRPYLLASVGPVIGDSSASSIGGGGLTARSRSAVTVGGTVGVGADVLAGRNWSVGVGAGYNWMANFSTSIGSRRNYSGFDVSISLGWLWGKGY